MTKATQNFIEECRADGAVKPVHDHTRSANSASQPGYQGAAKSKADMDDEADDFEDMFNDIPI